VTTFIKNIFFKTPNDWNIEKFEKYIYFQEGPGLRKWQFAEKGIPFLNIRCIKDNDTIDKSKVQFLNEEEKEKYSHFMLEENDTILSSSGSVGKMAIITKKDLPLMLNTSIIRLKSKNKGKVLDNYMRYFVKSKLFSKQYMQESQGSAQVNFGPTHLKKMYISLPPLEEQKKIAEILSTVDQKIAFVDNRIEETELLKKGLMQKLLTEGIGHTEFKDSELGNIPVEWEIKTLGRLVKIISGQSPSKFDLTGSKYKFFKVNQLNFCEKYLTDSEYAFNQTINNLLPSGTIVFPKRGASIFTNKVRILTHESFIDTNLMALVTKEDLNNMYLFYLLVKFELSNIADTSSVPQINNKHIEPIKIPFPLLEEQR